MAQKWPKMAKNGLKIYGVYRKCSEILVDRAKIVKIWPFFGEKSLNGSKWPKMAKIGPPDPQFAASEVDFLPKIAKKYTAFHIRKIAKLQFPVLRRGAHTKRPKRGQKWLKIDKNG